MLAISVFMATEDEMYYHSPWVFFKYVYVEEFMLRFWHMVKYLYSQKYLHMIYMPACWWCHNEFLGAYLGSRSACEGFPQAGSVPSSSWWVFPGPRPREGVPVRAKLWFYVEEYLYVQKWLCSDGEVLVHAKADALQEGVLVC